MSLTASWVPSNTAISSPLVLCNSSLSLAEHNIRLNGRALTEVLEAYQSQYTTQFYRYNDRLTLSFDTWRDSNFVSTPVVFPDPEGAFVAAALHLGGPSPGTVIQGTGTLTMVLVGSVTNATLTFFNVTKQSIELNLWNGILLGFSYIFNASYVEQTA